MDTQKIMDILVSQALGNIEKAIASHPKASLLSQKMLIRIRNTVIHHAENFFAAVINSLTAEEIRFWASQIEASATPIGKSVNDKTIPLTMEFMDTCMSDIQKLAEE